MEPDAKTTLSADELIALIRERVRRGEWGGHADDTPIPDITWDPDPDADWCAASWSDAGGFQNSGFRAAVLEAYEWVRQRYNWRGN